MVKPVSIVLAGGLGSKLGEAYKNIPKCLIDAGSMPLIQRAMMYFEIGTRSQKVIISAGHLGEVVENYFSRRDVYFGCPVSVDTEVSPLGTGGALYRLFQKYGLSEAIVVNGDTILKVRGYTVDSFYRTIYMMKPDSLGLFSVVPVSNSSYKYVVSYDENLKISSFQKNYTDRVPASVNAGVYFIKRDIFKYKPSEKVFSLERELIPNLLEQKGSIYAFPVTSDTFVDITTSNDVDYVNEHIKEISQKETIWQVKSN